MAKSDSLGKAPVGELLWAYAAPAIIGMVVVSMYNIVDRVFLGQGVGPAAISGLTLTFPLMNLVAAIGTLVGAGASARVSIVLGKKDVEWARNIVGNAFIMTFIMSAAFITPAMIWMDEIIMAFGGSPETLPYAREYLMIVIPGSVLTNLTYSFNGMIRSEGYPQKSMMIILVGIILNTILDPIFIIGFGMGIRGAAIATVISMAVSMVIVMTHFFNKRHTLHFTLKAFRLKGYIIKNVTSIGMAPFLMNVAACGVNIIFTRLFYEHGGDDAVGAFGIVASYVMLFVMVIMGLCQGMQPIVGYNYGAGKIKRMKDTLLLTMKWATLVVVIGFLAMELFPRQLCMAFNPSEAMLDIAVKGMRIDIAVFPLIGIQIVIAQFFMAIGRAKKSVFLSLSRQVLFLIPLVIVLAGRYGLTGVWVANPIADTISTVVSLLLLRHERNIFYPQKRKAKTVVTTKQ